ncbi:hypothetical protein LCGC14_2116320 [marine sediment metagenome]|uniref:Transmembrane Fragile-X-F protein n=1 Tax=marine sediment metagenome TaxID=412755 RepID=A0A0F9H1Y0_9ZZZZ
MSNTLVETTPATVSGGTGITGLLTVAFVVLKLVGVIGWSWWWVLSPLWIEAALVVSILIIVGIVLLIIYLVSGRRLI